MVSNKASLVGTPTPLLQATSRLPSTSSQAPVALHQDVSSTQQPTIVPSKILPIKTLTPYYKHWSIEGRALTKTPIHEFHKADREGKVFGFDLIDKAGSEIHITCFNKLVDEFYNVVHSNNLYIISNGHIQVASKKYNSSTNPFEIFLQKSTITPSPCVDSTIPMDSLHIKSIDSLPSLPINSLVDVLGILLSVSPTSTIRKRNGTEIVKCTATITDMSCLTIDVTLWGHHCEFEGKELSGLPLLPTPPTSWRGKALDTIFATTIVINPKLLEASTLHDWYATVGKETPFISLSIDNLSSNKVFKSN